MFVYLVAGVGLFWDKNIANWFILRGKYRWLVADKPNEQGAYPKCCNFLLAQKH
jgi:hypothetical protein